MAGASLALATAVLKDIYGDMNEQINSETPTLDGIKSTSKNLEKGGGNGIRFTAHVGRNSGMGARGEDEDLPIASKQQYVDGRTGMKTMYGSVRVTGHVMKQASADYQSFVDVATEEVERIKTDLAKDQNRQVYGDGTGTLATVITAATSATIAVDQVKYFRSWRGMTVDVLQFSTLAANPPTNRSTYAVAVTGFDPVAKTVTLASSITVTVGDVIIRSDRDASGGVNSWNKEWSGFGKMFSDTTVYAGIDPSTEPEWKSLVRDLTTGGNPGTLTEEDLIDFVTDLREGGDVPSAMWTTHKVLKSYWKDLEGKRTYVNTNDMKGGMGKTPTFESEFGTIPFKSDYDAPAGKIWFVSESKINMNTLVGWEWIDEDGSMWKQVPKRDAFVAYLRNMSELSTYRRNVHGVLKGIAE